MRARRFSIGQLLIGLIMIALSLTILIPLLNMVARSLSGSLVSPSMSGLELLPREPSAINYQIVFSNPNIFPAFMASVVITLIGTVVNITLTLMAAYALTRPGLVGKPIIMGFLIVMMLFDPGLVPEYLVVQKLGLLGSWWSVILSMAVNVYYLIIMMRYLEDVPASIFEAARIDGAGHVKTLFAIAAPLAKAGVATITMFYAVVRWNEYVRAGLYIKSIKRTTLQVILRKFIVENDIASIIGHQNVLNYNDFAKVDYTALQFAAIIVSLIPIFCIYPFVLKYFQKGILTGGVKE